jgi:predicted Zn-dependent protease
VNPVTGENQFSIVSASQEVDIGRKQYIPSQQSQGGRYTVDPELSLYVSSVGKRLAAASDRPNLPYEFVVLNNGVPNAWALPGGKIAVNRGLLTELEDEAQLAAVLSHEIVHAAARHGASQMSQGMLLGLGGQLATAATQNTGYGGLVAQGSQLGSALWQSRYGRDHELESDFYGMQYMTKAGYDPVAAIELQQKFVELSKGRQSDWLSGLFASHPPSQERVDKNRQHAAKLAGSTRNRSQFQRAMAQVKRDEKAYETHTNGMKALSEKKFSEAETLFASARKAQPREALFWVGEGQAELALKKYSEAKSSFSKAVSVNPEYFMSLLGRGLAEKELGNNTRAEQDLNASQKLLPTQTASYALGEINLQQGDRQSAIGYFQQVTQAGGSLAPAAQKQLQALQ